MSLQQDHGYLLESAGHGPRVHALHDAMPKAPALPWVELEPAQGADPDLSPKPKERNEWWHVIVRREPERDE